MLTWNNIISGWPTSTMSQHDTKMAERSRLETLHNTTPCVGDRYEVDENERRNTVERSGAVGNTRY